MPIKPWGRRILVDLHWQGPRMFSLNRLPETVPGYKGVYLISSRKGLYNYPHGLSSLAYIGSGNVADRLYSHAHRNDYLIARLEEEGTMWFWYASASRGYHPCVEQVLFDEFILRHGSLPLLNRLRPGCSMDWANVKVRHHNLAFPFEFSLREHPWRLGSSILAKAVPR